MKCWHAGGVVLVLWQPPSGQAQPLPKLVLTSTLNPHFFRLNMRVFTNMELFLYIPKNTVVEQMQLSRISSPACHEVRPDVDGPPSSAPARKEESKSTAYNVGISQTHFVQNQ